MTDGPPEVTNRPAFTVVVPVLNEEQLLETTLRSLRAQTFAEFELIVVDNGSTDRSPEIAARFADQVLVEPERGVLRAMHRGFLAAQGELIAAADADTIYPPRWLARMAAALREPDVVAAYGPMGFRETRRPLQILQAGGYCVLAGLSRVGGVRLAGAANLGMRRAAYLAVGGYLPFMDRASPDFRLVLALATLGRVRFVPTMACYTSNRRFVRKNLIHGFLEAGGYWLDVATHRDRIPGERYWTNRAREDRGPNKA